LSALHEENIKEDVHESGDRLQAKTFCFSEGEDATFRYKQALAVSNAMNSNLILKGKKQQSGLCENDELDQR
jgi:hypothetical protein